MIGYFYVDRTGIAPVMSLVKGDILLIKITGFYHKLTQRKIPAFAGTFL